MLPDDYKEGLDPRLAATQALIEDAQREFVPVSADLDAKAAADVRAALDALNEALAAANKRGLDSDITFRETQQQFVLLRISKTL